MTCREGIDPADFFPGALDPGDAVDPSTLIIDDVDVVLDTSTNRMWAHFTVGVTNVNFNNDITFRYSTADGSAIGSGGNPDYASASNLLRTIVAGDASVPVDVEVLAGSPKHTGRKYFLVNLSSPTNATIDDAQGRADVDFDALIGGTDQPPPPPPPIPDYEKAQYTGWSEADRVTHDQFIGCAYDTACTAFAVAAAMTALAAKVGAGKWRFDPRKLFDDMGGTDCLTSAGTCDHSICHGESPGKAVNWARNTGVRRIDKNPNNVGGTNWSCKSRDVTADHALFKLSSSTELGGSNVTKATLLTNIKKAIAGNGAVYMASIFYSNWNNCRSADNYVLRPHGTDHSALGHAWVLLGWDDNYLVPNVPSVFGSLAGQRVGCFRIQSSHGCDWGVNGRGWIPYSYLTTTWPSGSTGPRYRYWKLVWGGAA